MLQTPIPSSTSDSTSPEILYRHLRDSNSVTARRSCIPLLDTPMVFLNNVWCTVFTHASLKVCATCVHLTYTRDHNKLMYGLKFIKLTSSRMTTSKSRNFNRLKLQCITAETFPDTKV
ncbi:hypothetical protein Btru_031245 [Bulinus truncatus]|nr:hypothetical protein Btru_031245 [Bulinus truncatus]